MESSWSPELPECPVCLQSYDSDCTIPRVVACGHTACEGCLKSLPQKYPLTIRCPACTQLVKFPPQGASFLPKNIDLLRLIPTQNPLKHPQIHKNTILPKHAVDTSSSFVPRFWSDDFYAAWIGWILPNDAVSLEEDDERVSLFNVVADFTDAHDEISESVLKFSYVVKIMNFLSAMREEARTELGLVLKACSSKRCRVCEVRGIWRSSEDGSLYLVWERFRVLDKLGAFESGLGKDGLFLSTFAVMGMELCEAVIGLHLEGLNLGCLSLSCFELDSFGHFSLSLGDVLAAGKSAWEDVRKAGCIGVREISMLVGEFSRKEMFLSPEVLFEMLKKEGVEIQCTESGLSLGHRADSWALGCVLLTVLVGKQFVEEVVDYVDRDILKVIEDNGLDWSGLYKGLVEKVRSLLESKFGEELGSLQHLLCRCLNFDPESRPLVTDVWKCIRELIIGVQFDNIVGSDGNVQIENKGQVLVLGELCRVPKKVSEVHKRDELQGTENCGRENQVQVEEVKIEKGLVDGLLEGKFKFKDMHGHRDCISGLAIGGGFLFSSSYDKSVQVWSLQDFRCVHTFKGHEHKVMAIIYVDEEQPLCISGDSGGGIFIWSIGVPLGQEPLKKWYEQKDWRYSGIHALTTASNGYLYTGSGDRSIKAWSLQDGSLSCTMDGHKSTISTLSTSNGILYSGSWDGTIRLWSLCDHSILTVLGEDMPGTVTSVLSLIPYQDILIAAHENGDIKVWRNEVLVKSIKPHSGAVFATGMEGKWLFTGGWDKTVNVQELSGDEIAVDIRPFGSILGGSVITALLCWEGKLFVGYGDRTIKVYYHGN